MTSIPIGFDVRSIIIIRNLLECMNNNSNNNKTDGLLVLRQISVQEIQNRRTKVKKLSMENPGRMIKSLLLLNCNSITHTSYAISRDTCTKTTLKRNKIGTIQPWHVYKLLKFGIEQQ